MSSFSLSSRANNCHTKRLVLVCGLSMVLLILDSLMRSVVTTTKLSTSDRWALAMQAPTATSNSSSRSTFTTSNTTTTTTTSGRGNSKRTSNSSGPEAFPTIRTSKNNTTKDSNANSNTNNASLSSSVQQQQPSSQSHTMALTNACTQAQLDVIRYQFATRRLLQNETNTMDK